jgi:lysozyme
LYNDKAGYCTLGFGHLVHGHSSCTQQDITNYDSCGNPTGCTSESTENWQASHQNGQGQTKEEAETQLRNDIQTKETEVSNSLGQDVQLTQNQFDALLLLAFNAGAGGTLGKGHTLGDDIRAGNCDHTKIADDFRLYNHSGGQVDPNLTKRRETEAVLFNFGLYPFVRIR